MQLERLKAVVNRTGPKPTLEGFNVLQSVGAHGRVHVTNTNELAGRTASSTSAALERLSNQAKSRGAAQ
jgi:hypothetical protein